MAPWCSWLAREPVTLEVTGSSPVGVAIVGNRAKPSSNYKKLKVL